MGKRKKIVDDDATLELDTTIDIESSVDEEFYSVIPMSEDDYRTVHGVNIPEHRAASGHVLRFNRKSQLTTHYCDKISLIWSHNPEIDRSSKDAELKASVDSVLMQLEREVAHHSQQSASEPENNSKDKKKKKKKVKKKKITKA